MMYAMLGKPNMAEPRGPSPDEERHSGGNNGRGVNLFATDTPASPAARPDIPSPSGSAFQPINPTTSLSQVTRSLWRSQGQPTGEQRRHFRASAAPLVRPQTFHPYAKQVQPRRQITATAWRLPYQRGLSGLSPQGKPLLSSTLPPASGLGPPAGPRPPPSFLPPTGPMLSTEITPRISSLPPNGPRLLPSVIPPFGLQQTPDMLPLFSGSMPTTPGPRSDPPGWTMPFNVTRTVHTQHELLTNSATMGQGFPPPGLAVNFHPTQVGPSTSTGLPSEPGPSPLLHNLLADVETVDASALDLSFRRPTTHDAACGMSPLPTSSGFIPPNPEWFYTKRDIELLSSYAPLNPSKLYLVPQMSRALDARAIGSLLPQLSTPAGLVVKWSRWLGNSVTKIAELMDKVEDLQETINGMRTEMDIASTQNLARHTEAMELLKDIDDTVDSQLIFNHVTQLPDNAPHSSTDIPPVSQARSPSYTPTSPCYSPPPPSPDTMQDSQSSVSMEEPESFAQALNCSLAT